MWRQAHYRAAVDTALDAIIVIDEQGLIQSANAAVERVFGYRTDELTGRNVTALMPADHAARHDAHLAAYRETGHRRAIGIGRTLFGRRKDGVVFPIEASVAEWVADDGRRFFTGTLRDLTERQAAAAALQDSRAWLETVSDTALVGLLVVDRDHRIRFANRAFAALYGLVHRDFAGLPIAEVLPQIVRDAMRRRLETAFAGARGAHTSLEVTPGDGDRPRHLTSTVELSHTAVGDVVAVVVITDVTDLKRNEDDVRASRDLLQSVLDGTLDPIFAKDRDGRYVAINDSAARIIGRARQDIIGRDDNDLETAGIPAELMKQDRQVMASGVPSVAPFSTSLDGSDVHYVVTKRPWAAPDGAVRGMVGIAHDVTEQRKAAEERRAVTKRLHEAQEAERLRIARDLHDQVGQDLTALALGLQALTADVAQASHDKLTWLRRLADQIGRDLHRTALQLRSTTLDDLGLREAVTSHVMELGARFDLQVEVYLDEIDDCILGIDVELALFRAVQECLTNVLKHAEASAISISARRDGGCLRLIVEDNGRGFDVDTRPDPGRPGGLGLIGIRERLAAIGGTVTIESTLGQGTSVFIAVAAKRRPAD